MMADQQKTFIGVRILLGLTLLLLILVFMGGPGVHLGIWTPIDGFRLSFVGGYMGGLFLAGLSVVVMIIVAMDKKKRGMGKLMLTLCIGLLLAAPLGYLRLSGGGGIPMIHDITTDTIRPPEFIVLVEKRGEDANSLVYGGEELAAKQAAAYPDVKPLMVPDEPEAVFNKALDTARRLGWEIAGVDSAVKRFEATDYSFWFKFADDIVVIVKPTETGSRIDLRSISRAGRSDFGVNAARILRFQDNFVTTP